MFAVPRAAPIIFRVHPILNSCPSVKTLYCTEIMFVAITSQRFQGTQTFSISNFYQLYQFLPPFNLWIEQDSAKGETGMGVWVEIVAFMETML